jgi:hypothetical protein
MEDVLLEKGGSAMTQAEDETGKRIEALERAFAART